MTAFGIDLGTTTTLIARASQGRDPETIETEVLKLEQPKNGKFFDWLPSVAFFPKTGEPVVGLWAKEDGPHHGAIRCVRAVKRLMGRELFLKHVGKTPFEVSALYLQETLRQRLERGYNLEDELTVTVPASYTTNQRRDTLRAIDLAFERLGYPRLGGEQRERLLISEPVAAMLAFIAWDMLKALHARQIDVDTRPKVLVYDIGGGTLDLTIVELAWRDAHGPRSLDNLQFNVLSISRLNQFGGEDFDLKLAREFLYPRLLQAFPELEKLELSDEERLALRYDLINEAERLKVELNTELEFGEETIRFSTTSLVVRGQEYPFAVELDRQQYEALIAPFLEEREGPKNALWPITELLRETGMTREDIHYFFPVGGMARLLPLQKALSRYWGRDAAFLRFPVPEAAVAQGAAVYSHLKSARQGFKIDEPAADAYYIRLTKEFDLLLRRNQRKGGRHRYFLPNKSSELLLQIFAGADPPDDADPPADTALRSIYHTLVYQGGTAIPLNGVYEAKIPVTIEMERRYDTKVPIVRVWVGEPLVFVGEIDFEQLESKQEEKRHAQGL